MIGFIPAMWERIHLDFRQWFSVISMSDLISLAALVVGVILLVTGRGRRREQNFHPGGVALRGMRSGKSMMPNVRPISEYPRARENHFEDQTGFSVALIGEPAVKWKKFAESSLRPLVQDTVISWSDNLALVVQLHVKSPLKRKVEVALDLLNTRWTEIPDNQPRLSQVSTGSFTVSFNLDSQIEPGLYHAEVNLTPYGEERRGVSFSFEIPRVYPES